MKKRFLPLMASAMLASFALASCGGNDPAPVSSSSEMTPQEKYGYADLYTKIPLPNSYLAEVANKGTIEKLTYTTHSYALEAVLKEDNITLEKSLNVYLPYGYSEAKQYNVVYLLHGTEGEGDPENLADYWIGTEGKAKTTVAMFDNLFASGKLKQDMIIVSPTYYSRVEGKNPTQAQYDALKQELGETSEEWSKDGEQTLWTRFFGDELVNDIIPLVESKYSTYLEGEATKENIAASRDHRAYAGLSRGSMTSVNSIMMKHLDAFSYIGSFSGIWADFDQFKSLMNTTWANYPVKYWYNGNGTQDFSLEDHVAFKDKVLAEMKDRFVDGDNYCWINLKGGAHAYNNWLVQAYNALLIFFTK